MEPAPSPAPVPAAPHPPGVLVSLLVLAALYVLGIVAQAAHPVFGLAWTEVFVLLLPAVIAADGANLRPAAVLRMRWPGARRVALGFAVGIAGYFVASALMAGVTMVLPAEWVERFDVAKLFELPGWQPAGIAVVASVLAPICEETTFRGWFLSAFSKHRPAVAIALSATLFAALHVDPVRLVPVFALGLLFGWLAWRAGSIWPAVAAHAANNAGASALGFVLGPDAAREVEPARAGPVLAMLGFGALVVAATAALYARATPRPPALADALVARRADDPGRFSLRRVPIELLVLAALGIGAVPIMLLHAMMRAR